MHTYKCEALNKTEIETLGILLAKTLNVISENLSLCGSETTPPSHYMFINQLHVRGSKK